MNLKDLKYLVALSEYRHFGKAADSCFVSQPTLSMQIKKLEDLLGVQLIERTNKSVMLSEIGIEISTRAKKILAQADEIKELAKSAKDPYSGELKIGIIPTLAPYLLPHIVPKLSKSFPKLALYLVEEQTVYLLDKLEQGKIDAAILALPLGDTKLIAIPLFEEEFLLAVPKTHALAERKFVKQADLANKSLLLLDDGHCLRDQALLYCQQAHAAEMKGFRATSLETLRQMVITGLGITLMPKLACKADSGIRYIPFSSPKPTRTIGMLWRSAISKKNLLEDIAATISIAI